MRKSRSGFFPTLDLQAALLDAVSEQPDIALTLGTKADDFAIHKFFHKEKIIPVKQIDVLNAENGAPYANINIV